MKEGPKITQTMLYHFVKSLVENWESLGAMYKNQFAVVLVETLAATLKRIEAQEAQEERRRDGGGA